MPTNQIDPMLIARERVQRGVKLLDEKVPGWRAKIDLLRFDITSRCGCALGQTYGEYDEGIGCLNLRFNEAVEHGFTSEGYFIDPEWNHLQSAWLEELRK